MEKKVRMRYVTCAVCGKRSRQSRLSAEQEYGWEPWFLDGMPKYSEREKVFISEVCPYCGYSYPSLEEDGIANELDFKSQEYRNPLREDPEKIRSLGIADLMDEVKACMRSAYLMKSSDVECYRMALEEYLTAVWLIEREMRRAASKCDTDARYAQGERPVDTGMNQQDAYMDGIREVCESVRSICLEKAIYCCSMIRKRDKRNENTILLIELYRRRGLMDLAMAYIEEMLENEMWDSMDEKLMLRHQMGLCNRKETRPATLVMGETEE